VRNYAARCRPRKVSTKHQDGLVRVAIQELPSRLDRLHDAKVKIATYVRQGTLDWMMHQITRYNRVIPARRNSNAHMSWGMSRSRLQFDFVTEPVIGIDQLMHAGLYDWKD